MKNRIPILQGTALLLCLFFTVVARGQFVNGNFQSALGGNGACDAGTTWSTSSGSAKPQYVVSGSNAWIDITPCWSWGNGSWVQQNITTVPGKWYIIELDLGTWVGWQQFDAGVDVLINGTQLGGRVFHNTYGSNPEWRTRRTCMFQATSTSTTVKIVGNGANPVYPSYPQSIPGPGVMGLDNVELIQTDTLSHLDLDSTYCNRYCLTLDVDSLLAKALAASVSNVRWYVNNTLEQTGGMQFCRKYPKGVTKNVMVIFTVTDSCGSHDDTLYKSITAWEDCDCDLDNILQMDVVQTGCNSFHFDLSIDPWFSISSTQWTVNGIPVAGTPTSFDMVQYGPGTYIVCATVVVHVEGGEDFICRICRQVNIVYNEIYNPDEIYELCQGTYPYIPGCGAPYTRYELTGTGGYSQSGSLPAPVNNLPIGNYTLKCYDDANCTVLITNIIINQMPYRYTYCDVYLQGCDQLTPDFIAEQLLHCEDCWNIFMNGTAGNWEQVSYDENTGQLVVRREYTDPVNCRKCVVTFHLASVPATVVNLVAQPCVVLTNRDLIRCLQNKNVKIYIEGYSQFAWDGNAGAGIELCCENEYGIVNPTYYIYSPDDPCCFMVIHLICEGTPEGKPESNGNGITPAASGETARQTSLSIVPNPASSVFRVVSVKGYTTYDKIDIVDLNGKVVLSKTNISSDSTIDVSKLSKGTYFVNVYTSSGLTVLKLVALQE